MTPLMEIGIGFSIGWSLGWVTSRVLHRKTRAQRRAQEDALEHARRTVAAAGPILRAEIERLQDEIERERQRLH